METIYVQNTPIKKLAELDTWGMNGTDNAYDRDVLMYPATQVLRATQTGKTVLYMPVQTALVLESLAVNPEASKHEVTVSLREMVVSLRLQAQQKGIGEIVFLGSNEATNQFAVKHGFEELPWKVFRMKTFDKEDLYDTKPHTPDGL